MFAALNATDIAMLGAMMVTLALIASLRKGSPTDARLRRIDRKLDVILENLGIELSETVVSGLSSEVCRLADRGEKIEAIKRHREETGVGLKEAKDAVEAYLER